MTRWLVERDQMAVRAERLDEILDALSDRRRREVLYALEEIDARRAPVDAVVDRVTARLDGVPPERCAVGLQHVGLPKLAEAGIVDFDDEAEVVEYDPPAVAVAVLELTARAEAD